MRKLIGFAASLVLAAGLSQARASVIYTEQGFTLKLAPDNFDYFVNSNPNYIGYCPACLGTPDVLTITDGGTAFDLLSLKIAGFEPVSLKVKVENAAHKLLDTIAVTNAAGSSGDPSGFASVPVDTGFVKQIEFVPVATGPDRGDCICISDLQFKVGSTLLTLLANPVPEPASVAILLAGVLGVGYWSRRR